MAEYDYQAIRAAIEKLHHWQCPACKTAEDSVWGAGDVVVSLPVTDRATDNGRPLDQAKRPSIDVVPVICDGCGWVQLFDVATLTRARPDPPSG
jgi:hypothetical protein